MTPSVDNTVQGAARGQKLRPWSCLDGRGGHVNTAAGVNREAD